MPLRKSPVAGRPACSLHGTSAKQTLNSARRCNTRTDVIKIRVIVSGRGCQRKGD